MKLTEVLDRPEHWCQGAYHRRGRQRIEALCLSAAITAACGGLRIGEPCAPPGVIDWPRVDRYRRIAVAVIADQDEEALILDAAEDTVIEYNDLPGRTFDEVHALAAEIDRRMLLEEATS